jgi:hypothetical protein
MRILKSTMIRGFLILMVLSLVCVWACSKKANTPSPAKPDTGQSQPAQSQPEQSRSEKPENAPPIINPAQAMIDALPDLIEKDISEFSTVVPPGFLWSDPKICHVFKKEMKINLHNATINSLETSFDNNDVYEITFYSNGKELKKINLGKSPAGGMQPYKADFSPPLQSVEYATITATGDASYSVGHFIIK